MTKQPEFEPHANSSAYLCRRYIAFARQYYADDEKRNLRNPLDVNAAAAYAQAGLWACNMRNYASRMNYNIHLLLD
jgi:hypothetical protein